MSTRIIVMILLSMLIAPVMIWWLVSRPHHQTGGRTELPIVLPKSEQTAYYPQYMELHNVDNVLNRPVGEKNEDIDGTVPVLEETPDQQQSAPGLVVRQAQEIQEFPKYYLDFKDIYRRPLDKDTETMVESVQPYFLGKAEILDLYGQYYYRDWRYPLQPIRLEFALDPQKFVREHPVEYPSYVIRSRDLRDTQPRVQDWLYEGTRRNVF